MILKVWSLIEPPCWTPRREETALPGVALGFLLSGGSYTIPRAFDIYGAVPQSYSTLCCVSITHTHTHRHTQFIHTYTESCSQTYTDSVYSCKLSVLLFLYCFTTESKYCNKPQSGNDALHREMYDRRYLHRSLYHKGHFHIKAAEVEICRKGFKGRATLSIFSW